MSTFAAIADALVSSLQTRGFSEAERRPLPYMRREDCAARKCVVLVRGADYGDESREDFDQLVELTIAIQKGVADVSANTETDTLLADVQTLIRLWGEAGALRTAVLQGAVYDSGPLHPTGTIYEFQQLLELQLFTSITLVRYRIEG
jgi:hypothetical protein